jgi:hypothetical protein
MKIFQLIMGLVLTSAAMSPAFADPSQITGKVIRSGGHQNPACRLVTVRRNDNGQLVALRLPNASGETSLSAITITALTSGYNVVVAYDTSVGSGCGTEPVIQWVDLYAPGYP